MIRVAAIAALLCAAAPFSSNGAMVGSPFGQAPFGMPGPGLTSKSLQATFAATGKPYTDASTTTSVTFMPDGGGLFDASPNTWPPSGTVPQNAGPTAAPSYPNGFAGNSAGAAGPASAANYYNGVANGPLKFSGGTFAACAHWTTPTQTFPQAFMAQEDATHGWVLGLDGAFRPTIQFWQSGGAEKQRFDTVVPVLNGPNVVCGGADGAGNMNIKTNLGTMLTQTGLTYSVPAAVAPTLMINLSDPEGYAPNRTNMVGTAIWLWAAAEAPSDALFTAIQKQLFGMVLDTGQPLTDSRTTVDSDLLRAVRAWFPALVARIDELGLRTDSISKNYWINPTAPATQTATLPTGNYTAWGEGSGSIVVAVGTATATGLPCTVTAGIANDCHFTVTGAGTVTGTKSGTVTFEQLEPVVARTQAMDGAGSIFTRAAESVYAPSVDVVDGSLADSFTATIVPAPLSTDSTHNLTVWSNPVGATTQRLVHLGSNNKWELQIAGQTVDSAALPLTNGTAVQFAGGWTVGKPVCLAVNGTQTCSAGNAAAFTPGPVLYLDSDATDGSNANLSSFQWNGRKRFPALKSKRVAFIGDSIFAMGAPTSAQKLITLKGIPSTWTEDNYSASGAAYVVVTAQYNNSVKGQGYDVLISDNGVNDVAGDLTGAAAWADIQPIYDDWIGTAGHVLVLVNIQPWSGYSGSNGSRQTQTLAYNVAEAAYVAANPTKVIGVDSYSACGSAADSTALSPVIDDGLHLHDNQIGWEYRAGLIRDAIVAHASMFQ